MSLYEYLAAPAWWIDDVSSAYGAIKLLGVLLMTAAIFPAYGLARLVVSRPWALFAAVGAVVAPALSYSPFLVEEPLAYPVSTLALYLIARAGSKPTWPAVALASGVCLLAIFVRTQLAVLLVVLFGALFARAWTSDRFRAWRATWTAWDWAGAVVLVVGLAVLFAAAAGRHSYSWYVTTTSFKDRMLEYGLWAVGALGIGLGVIPLIAGLVALVRPRGERDARTNVFVAMCVSAFAAFGLYTAVKVAYLSTNTSIVIAERNLIYLTPLLFVGTALVLERRSISLAATAVATAFALYLVATTPYALETYPNYETHGLAIAAFANRIPKWPARDDREHPAPRSRSRPGSRSWRCDFVRGAGARRGGGHDRCLRAHVEPDHRDLCRQRRAGRLRSAVRDAAEAAGLGRRRHRRRAVRLRRPGDQRPEPVLAARVLEPVDEVGVGARRQHAAAA